MTPIIMGAGYGAGVYFFYRVSTADRWHTVAPVFLGITTFTWAMAIATVLHWANFNHGHHTFVLWVILYAVTPVLVPGLWLLNRRTDSGTRSPESPDLPRPVRVVAGGLGVSVTASAILLFLLPELMIASWPWAVSPLTARILAGWFALFGVVNVAVAFDHRRRLGVSFDDRLLARRSVGRRPVVVLNDGLVGVLNDGLVGVLNGGPVGVLNGGPVGVLNGGLVVEDSWIDFDVGVVFECGFGDRCADSVGDALSFLALEGVGRPCRPHRRSFVGAEYRLVVDVVRDGTAGNRVGRGIGVTLVVFGSRVVTLTAVCRGR